MNEGPEQHPPRSGAVRRVTFGLLLSFSSLHASACAPEPANVVAGASLPPLAAMPGPAPRARTAEHAQALNATCTACHREIAAEWANSFHAQSERDAAYQRAFRIEPLPFCQGCHAPEADVEQPVPQGAAAIGVGCVTCHVVGDDVLAAPKAIEGGRAPHALTRSAAFASEAACANCHQFAFPGRATAVDLMQATVREHAESAARGTTCASCHMARVGAGHDSHLSHAFPGGHDRNLVKSALRVEVRRCAELRVCFALTPHRLGHAFPTGDLFRRIELSVEAVGDDQQVVSSARRYLSRHWTEQPKAVSPLRRVVRDDRVAGEARSFELELEPSATRYALLWRVAYQRVEHPRSESDADSVLEGEIEIASGSLPSWSKGEPHDVHP